MAKRKNFEAILVSTQNDRASFSRGDCHQPIRTSTSGSSIGAPSRRSLSTMFTKDNGVRRSKASCNSDSFHQRILSKTIASSASLIWDESARHERRNIARSGNNACCGNQKCVGVSKELGHFYSVESNLFLLRSETLRRAFVGLDIAAGRNPKWSDAVQPGYASKVLPSPE
jgi:hypothetical protein